MTRAKKPGVTRRAMIGLVAILLIIAALVAVVLYEPFREHDAQVVQQHAALTRATELYSTNCAGCHGAFGEGLGQTPALNATTVRVKDSAELFKAIEQGRANTTMSAFGEAEGGILTNAEIDDLVTLIQHGSWRSVQTYLEEQGLVPTAAPSVEQQFNVAGLSSPLKTVTHGWDVFRGTCMSCHSLSTTDTTQAIGKKLLDNPFIKQSTDDQLVAFLKVGRAANDPANSTGNTMPARGGNPNLTDDDLRSVAAFLHELNKGTVNLNNAARPAKNTSGSFDGVTYQWTKFAEHFDNPISMTFAPDHSGRLFVTEQIGMVFVVDGKGQVNPTPFLDITDLLPSRVYSGIYTEQGLLGLAFHPDFAKNGVFFISYTDANVNSVIARYRVLPDNPNRADPNSGVILLKFHQPYQEHKGGQIAFGPDGYLYAGFGDGGNPAIPSYRSQNPQSYLGKMLRLDVSDVNAKTYKIPPDNPYVGNPKYLPEIWALGLRNPWRWSFDRQTGDLFIGDVGQWLYEALDYQPASSPGGENYRWSAFEGVHTYLKDQPVVGQPTWPIVEYKHDQGQAIIGGYVYRGGALPGLVGKYIYGDYIYSTVWILKHDVAGKWQNQVFMAGTGFNMSAFAEDADGELYLLDLKGVIYRLTKGS